MKSLREVGLLVAVAAALLVPARTVSAQHCPAGCGMQKRACLRCRAPLSAGEARICAGGSAALPGHDAALRRNG